MLFMSFLPLREGERNGRATDQMPLEPQSRGACRVCGESVRSNRPAEEETTTRRARGTGRFAHLGTASSGCPAGSGVVGGGVRAFVVVPVVWPMSGSGPALGLATFNLTIAGAVGGVLRSRLASVVGMPRRVGWACKTPSLKVPPALDGQKLDRFARAGARS